MKPVTAIILCVFCVSFISSCANKAKESTTLTVHSLFGEAKAVSQSGERKLAPGDSIAQEDTILTGASSLIDIVYGTSGIIRINENSQVRMTALFTGEGANRSRMDLASGKMFVTVSKLAKGSSFEVASPTTIAAVRGTSFRVTADENSSRIDVLSGRIKVNPVREGKVIEDVETVIETNSTVSLDIKAVDRIVNEKKEIEVAVLKEEEITAIREEVKDIKPVERLEDTVKQEIRQVMVAPPVDTEAEKRREDEKKKQAELERAQAEKSRQDRLAAARSEKERLAREQAEKERLAHEQAEKERLERERIEKQKQETKEKRVKNIPNL
ncbi:MAG TPA: FecR domain-containing protein [Spirochaetota bacterium]|nr:FecR domain-containing protein [Spirochaetota bacterium]